MTKDEQIKAFLEFFEHVESVTLRSDGHIDALCVGGTDVIPKDSRIWDKWYKVCDTIDEIKGV